MLKPYEPPVGTHPASEGFQVLSAEAASRLPRDESEHFKFKVPVGWQSPIPKNPYAAESQLVVLDWFAKLECKPEELTRAKAFDTGGYVGIPFPLLSREKTILFAKYLSLWLLWDDAHVECLNDQCVVNKWLLSYAHLHNKRRPPGMTRFDEGWWQLFEKFAEVRSEHWINELCEAMATWWERAVEEAELIRNYQETGKLPKFEKQLKLRIDTIGMYATVYLLEDEYNIELPHEFHIHPTVKRIKDLANEIVGLGNDILSLGKDRVERQLNLVSTLMAEQDCNVAEAIKALIQQHNEALIEYDRLVTSLGSWSPDNERLNDTIERWFQDVRYASLGFSLWEAQAPRYTAYKVVYRDRVIEPSFVFFSPPQQSGDDRTGEAS